MNLTPCSSHEYLTSQILQEWKLARFPALVPLTRPTPNNQYRKPCLHKIIKNKYRLRNKLHHTYSPSDIGENIQTYPWITTSETAICFLPPFSDGSVPHCPPTYARLFQNKTSVSLDCQLQSVLSVLSTCKLSSSFLRRGAREGEDHVVRNYGSRYC
jgi:hypothetical protein